MRPRHHAPAPRHFPLLAHRAACPGALPLTSSAASAFMKRVLLALLGLAPLALPAAAQNLTTDAGKPVVQITDASIQAGQTVTWTKDNVYVLNGFVYVEDGATLTIQAGTVVKAQQGTGPAASALVICRGARLFALGSPTEPIVFTSVLDRVAVPDLSTANGGADGVDYRESGSRSLWGGIVLLGRASVNIGDNPLVEGLPNDDRARYGPGPGLAARDDDNSGTMRFVSIKYSGSVIEAGKELQSLTLAGVGSGTTVEYVESFMSGDDGFEWFGGTVSTHHLAVYGADDDSFDYDEGLRGNHQFWFALQTAANGDKLGEFDSGNATPSIKALPLAAPNVYNATLLGRGRSVAGGREALIYKEYGGGVFANSVISEVNNRAVTINADTEERFTLGGIAFRDNLVYVTGAMANFAPANTAWTAAAASNRTTNPLLTGVGREHTDAQKLDPRPAAGSPALTGAGTVPAGLVQTAYVGAFDGQTNWLAPWTAMATNGIAALANPVAREDDEAAGGLSVGTLSPNPARGPARLSFSLDRARHVRVSAYDVLGREVAVLADEQRPAGAQAVALDASALAPGLYVVRVQAEGRAASRLFAVAR